MRNLRKVVCTDGRIIMVDISDEACLEFGFKSGDLLLNPKGNEVTIIGVASSNEGPDVLWYEINNPKTKDKVCYWGGERNLIKAGFVKKIA